MSLEKNVLIEVLSLVLSNASGDEGERMNTGGAVLSVDRRTYEQLEKAGYLSDLGKYGKGIYFNGRYGQTFIVVKKRAASKYEQLKVSEERRQIICVKHARLMGWCDVEHFADIPDDVKKMLNTLSYYELVRPLALCDFKNGHSVSMIMTRYGLKRTNTYRWFRGL